MAQTTSVQPGPAESPEAFGVDEAFEKRPGVPMEAEPAPAEGVHRDTPEQQPVRITVFRHRGLRRVTPVFGTAQPPRGVSGLLRRLAYRIPEHQARHWMTLLAADRVDVLEGRLGRALARPLRGTPLSILAGQVEKNPVRAVGAVVGATLLAVYLAKRALD